MVLPSASWGKEKRCVTDPAYLGKGDIGNDDDVDSAGGVLGISVGVAAGMVAVGTRAAGLPGSSGSLGDLALRGRLGGGAACTRSKRDGQSVFEEHAVDGIGKVFIRTEVVSSAADSAGYDTAQNLTRTKLSASSSCSKPDRLSPTPASMSQMT